MLLHEYVTQPSGGVKYISMLSRVMEQTRVANCDAAVAYATTGGVDELDRACRSPNASNWRRIQKRWIVGIDYCRTDPLALRRLAAMPNSDVRIHDGLMVVERAGCTPRLPFHPKLYLLSGASSIAVVCGSGNVSRSGLSQGHEVGSLLLSTEQNRAEERAARNSFAALTTWYEALWSVASPAREILARYEAVHQEAPHLRCPTPTDDDTFAYGKRGLSAEDLRRFRACERLWVEAGKVTENRGVQPGNQLMLTRMTRVYFGFPAVDLPRNSAIGTIGISYAGAGRRECYLTYSDNGMDKLTLPIPGSGGPSHYDDSVLLFERKRTHEFTLVCGTPDDRQRWMKASARVDGLYRMTSGRKWGVF